MNLLKKQIFRMAQNLVVPGLIALMASASAAAREIVLQDDRALIAFDAKSGAITRMEDKATHWKIERRPELGVSFRLFAPLPERRWNPVLGQKQSVAKIKKLSEHEVRLQWKNLNSENGGVLPMTLTADVTLTNGVLTFNTELKNDSALTVETIDYPYFGDFNPPSREFTNNVLMMSRGNADELGANEIYPHFRNEKGYWGVFWPTKMLEADRSLFCLVQSPDKGMYVGVTPAAAPYRVQYTFELHPGVISAVSSLVPSGDEIDGQPVHLEFRLCHLIFEPPHSTMKLAPIVMCSYRGDQHTGSDLYKQWHSTSSK
jgi:hypothetical protein